MKEIRVLLVENQTLVREGFKALLQGIEGFQVAGEAEDGRQALPRIRELRPNIVLMDIILPGLNGLEVASRALQECPETRIVFLSVYRNEEYVLQALRLGARGYLLKDARAEELAFALRSVARGDFYLSPEISRSVMEDYLARLEEMPGERQELPVFDRLTPRQREILQLIAEGHTTRAISALLNLSLKTVETHRTELMRRLDIHDIAGLVRYAIRTGLVGLD